jgi:hypothetical protein
MIRTFRSDYFEAFVKKLKVEEPTRAYVQGVFVEAVGTTNKFIERSVVLSFASATRDGSFEKLQGLADWILWSLSVVPTYHGSHEKIVLEVGRSSYSACWRIVRGKWYVYAELAEELPSIVETLRAGMAIKPSRL